jgi:hypothetical protein
METRRLEMRIRDGHGRRSGRRGGRRRALRSVRPGRRRGRPVREEAGEPDARDRGDGRGQDERALPAARRRLGGPDHARRLPGHRDAEARGRAVREERDRDVVLRAALVREAVDLLRDAVQRRGGLDGAEEALRFEDVGDAVARDDHDVAFLERDVGARVGNHARLLPQAPRERVRERTRDLFLG